MTGLGTWVDLLYGAEAPGSFVELRWRLRRGHGMGRDFIAIGDQRLGRVIEARGARSDLFAGVAPRARQEGTRAAVERLHVLWCDLDSPEAIARLADFEPRPSMVIRSGSGRHCYWALWPPASPDEAERGNRRLAHALGGDARATDAARILRPPESFNFKSGKPVPVTVERVDVRVWTVGEVVGELPDPPGPAAPPASAGPRPTSDDALLAIPPPLYIETLTGRQVGRDGKIACPFHEDRTPSLHVYPTAARGWCCHAGCGGGSIIDLGARLYGIEPRGRGYWEIRERLERELRAGLAGAAA